MKYQLLTSKPIWAVSLLMTLGVLATESALAKEQWSGAASGTLSQMFEAPSSFMEVNGKATGLIGEFSGNGHVNVDQDLILSGSQVWVAGNGALRFEMSGRRHLTIVEGVELIEGRMRLVEGSGVFANSSAEVQFTGVFDANDQSLEFEFTGEFFQDAFFSSSGSIELASLSNGLGQAVEYTMRGAEGWFHSGSFGPASTPIINDSSSKVSAIGFELLSSVHEEINEPVHWIQTLRGELFARLESMDSQILIEHGSGFATQFARGRLKIIGGTAGYKNASGYLLMTFETEASLGDGPVEGVFSLKGNIEIKNQGIDCALYDWREGGKKTTCQLETFEVEVVDSSTDGWKRE